MWMDHRASSEANYLNKCLNGGKFAACNTVNPISLEMQISKILWLKVNMSSQWWDNVGYLIDLSDYLSFRATDYNHRYFMIIIINQESAKLAKKFNFLNKKLD